MAFHELAQALDRTGILRQYRITRQVAAQIGGEGIGVRVARFAVRTQRFGDDGQQIGR